MSVASCARQTGIRPIRNGERGTAERLGDGGIGRGGEVGTRAIFSDLAESGGDVCRLARAAGCVLLSVL